MYILKGEPPVHIDIEDIDSKFTRKGNKFEQQAIDTLSFLHFENYQKNTERLENDWISAVVMNVQSESVFNLRIRNLSFSVFKHHNTYKFNVFFNILSEFGPSLIFDVVCGLR